VRHPLVLSGLVRAQGLICAVHGKRASVALHLNHTGPFSFKPTFLMPASLFRRCQLPTARAVWEDAQRASHSRRAALLHSRWQCTDDSRKSWHSLHAFVYNRRPFGFKNSRGVLEREEVSSPPA
jgi:hypothetical protein